MHGVQWRHRLENLRRIRPAWLLEAALVLAALSAISAYQSRGLAAGKLPSLTLPTLAGESFSTSELAGSPALIVFWAPWCGVCRLESQNVSWLRALVGARAKVLSIVVRYEAREQVDVFAREQQVDYPVLLGEPEIARRFRVRAYPTLLFIAPDGEIKRAAVGYTTLFGLLWRLFL
jgi:thiol-disulfide isomerase/thioredoxin